MEFTSVSVSEDYFSELSKILDKPKSAQALHEAIVNAPFHDPHKTTVLGLGIVVLLLVNKKDQTIDRIALADTDLAHSTVNISAKPFKEIRIPLDYTKNFIARAIRDHHYMITSDWQYMFNPALTPEEARFNQAAGGIACSVIYPLTGTNNTGAIIFSYYEPVERISKQHHHFMSRYCKLVERALSSFRNG